MLDPNTTPIIHTSEPQRCPWCDLGPLWRYDLERTAVHSKRRGEMRGEVTMVAPPDSTVRKPPL